MNSKLNVKRLTSAFFFVFITICCFAQNYSLKETKKGAVFYQRLEWDSTGVVTQYKVIVEQKINDKYVQIEECVTKNTFQDVSLDAGQYRFKVVFYNVFGQAAYETKYQNFEILAAHQPAISSKKISPVVLDDSQDLVCINVEVSDINASAKFSLINDKTDEIVISAPEKIEIKENQVYVYFKKSDLRSGKYKVVVKNPGGLKAESGTFSIKEKDPVYFDVSLSNNSILFLGKDYLPAVFNKQFVPFGIDGTAGVFFNLTKERALGLELNGAYNFLKRTEDDVILSAHMINSGLDVAYEQNVFNTGSVTFRACGNVGGGVSVLPCYSKTDEEKHIVSVLPYVNGGICLKILFSDYFYLKTKTEFFYVPEILDADYKIFSMNFLIGGGVRL